MSNKTTTPPTPPALSGGSPETLLRLLEQQPAQLSDTELAVCVLGEGPASEHHVRPSFFTGFGKRKRQFAVRTSMRDVGPNVVTWKLTSRIRVDQPPDGARLPVNVVAWCPPGSEGRFAEFYCRNERLRETLDRDVERVCMAALEESTHEVAGALQAAMDPAHSGCNPQDFGRLFRQMVQARMVKSMAVEKYGLEFRFAVDMPDLAPAFTGEHSVPLDLKGPMKLVLRSKVLLQIAGPAGLIAYLESGIKDLKEWCAGAVTHVMAHETFASDQLEFLSEFEAKHVPDIVKKMEHHAGSVGYRLKNLLSQPLLPDHSVPEVYHFLRNFSLDGSGEFESQDPGIKVPLRYSVHGKLRSLCTPRVRDAIECGRNLKGEIEREIRECLTRIVRDNSPNDAFLKFEPTTTASDGACLKKSLLAALGELLARYGMAGLDDLPATPEDPNRLRGAVEVSIRANDVSALWRALNHLEFQIAASYKSPDHPLLAGARLIGRFRVDAGRDGGGRNAGFLAFMRFARRREDAYSFTMDLDLKQAAEFIQQAASEFLDSQLCGLSPARFQGILKVLRRDVAHFAAEPAEAEAEAAAFKQQLEAWANDFCAQQYGLGVTLLYCNAELNKPLEDHLKEEANTILEVWKTKREYLRGQITGIYRQLGSDPDGIVGEERDRLLTRLAGLEAELRGPANGGGAPRLLRKDAGEAEQAKATVINLPEDEVLEA